MWLPVRTRERVGRGKGRGVMVEGVGSEGAGTLKGGVEIKRILRKGEKRTQKIKWLLYGVT